MYIYVYMYICINICNMITITIVYAIIIISSINVIKGWLRRRRRPGEGLKIQQRGVRWKQGVVVYIIS